MQKSQLNLLTILFERLAFSHPIDCCDAAKLVGGNYFHIHTCGY